MAFDTIALAGLGLMIFQAVVTRQAAFAIEAGSVRDIRVRIVACDAREIPMLKTFAAHQPDRLIADVDGRVGIAFGLIAMARRAEVHERTRVEVAWIGHRAACLRVFARAWVTAITGNGGDEAVLVWQSAGRMAAETAP
jgi:hypothetical protein